MKSVEPKVYLISTPTIDWPGLSSYLESIGGDEWANSNSKTTAGEMLVEVGGRICYKSWLPGLNKNVTRVRKDSGKYFQNLLASGHGSVLEHANYSFILQNVSRVFTHELVRHRVGVAISQESLRYVRTDEIRTWLPPELTEDLDPINNYLASVEIFTDNLNTKLLDGQTSFEKKKKITSAIRRLLPQGMATDLLWTANIRTLRHCIEMRTAAGAEAEIRLVFDMIGKIMVEECPLLFGDYTVNEEGEWATSYRKV
jgi:thymidylate synthase (FAD)